MHFAGNLGSAVGDLLEMREIGRILDEQHTTCKLSFFSL